jgi:hypothetical protein
VIACQNTKSGSCKLPEELPRQKNVPLEPTTVWIGEDKLSSDVADLLGYWVHKQLAEKKNHHLKILSPQKNQEVAWKKVHSALCDATSMFHVFAYNQVTDIAGVNVNLDKYIEHQDTACPSFEQEADTCQHILHCEEEGRVVALNCTIDPIDSWLRMLSGVHPVIWLTKNF